MARYTATVSSPRSAEANFDDIGDFTTVHEWDPGIDRAHLTAGTDPHAVGSRIHVVQKTFGREVEIDYEVTASERPRRIVLRGENSSVVSIDTITFEPRGAGSAVTYDAQIELKGARKLFEPLMGLFMKKIGDDAKAGLQDRVGASGGGGSSVGSRPAR